MLRHRYSYPAASIRSDVERKDPKQVEESVTELLEARGVDSAETRAPDRE